MGKRHSFYAAAAASVVAALLSAGCSQKPDALVASAKEYLARNDSTAAVIELRTALQQDPDIAEARFLLGRTLLEAEDIAGAEKELRTALELQFPAELTVPPLARALVLLGRHKEVTTEYSNTEIASNEGRAELLTAVGNAYLGLDNPKAAMAALAAALQAQPGYVPAQIATARVAAITGNLSEALRLTEAVLLSAPSDPDAWLLKGDVLLAQKNRDDAVAAFGKALAARPNVPRAHAAIISLLLAEGRVDDAAKQLDAMKRVAPRHPQTLYTQALLAYRQQNFTAARQALQQQLRIEPENLAALLLAGAVELELRSYAQAENHLRQLLQRSPQQQLARRMLAGTYLRKGQPSLALDVLDPLLQSSHPDADTLTLAGEAYMMNGESDRATQYFSKAAALDSSNATRRTTLMLSRIARGDSDKALRDLEQTVATDSGIRGDLVLISTYMQRREYDKALGVAAALEKKQVTRAVTHNLRGAILLARQDRDGARRSFELALQNDHSYFPAALNLAQIDLVEKKPAAARQRFEAILKGKPNDMAALLGLAAVEAETAVAQRRTASGAPAAQSSTDAATALINKAIAAYPRDPAPRLALIRHHLRSTEAAKAAQAGRDAVAAFPGNVEVIDFAGRAHLAAGEHGQALALYKRLVSLQASSPQAHLRLAEAHFALKSTDEASESLRKALALKADFVEAQRALVAVYMESGQTKQAISVARDIQKQRPNAAIGYMLEGDIHAFHKRWADAGAAYRAGLSHGASTDLAVKLHKALVAAGGNEADRFATAWLRDFPNASGFRVYLAQTATAAKDFHAAARQYRKVLESAPESVLALNNLAWVESQLNEPSAIQHAEKALALAPDQPAIMDTLGVLLVERGETARGIDLLQKATAMAPKSASIRLNYAKALIKSGDKEAARKQLDELTKLGGKSPTQQELAQLRARL